MGAPKGRCDGCRELKAECACLIVDEVTESGFMAGLRAQQQSPEVAEAMARVRDAARVDLPADCGPLIRSMMSGDPEPGEGPPYAHVHRFPEDPGEDEEAPYVPPPPAFTVVVKATKRGTCRHCGIPITHGPRGWRDDDDGPLAYGCAEAALGFHEA